MLISLSWLEKYVPVPVDVPQFVEDLTMAGLNVEKTIARGFADPALVIGRVLDVRQHPNADKLRLCRVRVDSQTTTDIVCGAPNVADGQWVVVARPGAKLPDGTKIRSAKIRGQRSDGMICSEKELGLGDDAAGIIVLEGTYTEGQPIGEVLAPPDTVLEIEVTPNRSDLLSHIGVAREVAAIYREPVKAVGSREPRPLADTNEFKVEIENLEDCRRYVGQRISDVRVGPSPAWLANAIQSVGLHSVNNVVDVTNYVLMEMGQPIHAFDLQRLGGSQVIVRRGQEGERLVALDGNTYELDAGMLVIADVREAVAVAGVIGGDATAVHSDTVEVLIESANFSPLLVRRTSKRLGLSTEASYRFERGVDRELCRVAAERAAELIREVAGGQPGDAIDLYPNRYEVSSVRLRRSASRRILGVDLDVDEMESLLLRLGFDIDAKTDEDLRVVVPSHRGDIVEEIDLIEEVGRLYGYNQIGKGWGFRCTTFAEVDDFDRFREAICNHLASRGFNEVIASAFTDGRELEDFGWPEGDPRRTPIAIRNPLNRNHRYLRTSLVPGMLDIVRRNLDHGVRRLRLYQDGRVYLLLDSHEQLPQERNLCGIVVTAPAGQDFWYRSKETVDLYEIKAEIEVLLSTLNVDFATQLSYDFDDDSGAFTYAIQKEVVIEGGIVSNSVSARYDFDQPVWYATLDVDALYKLRGVRVRPRALPEYPSSKRDLSLVAGENVRFDRIEKILAKSGGRLLESLQLFDVYRGEQVAVNRTAYGIRLSFRSPERTLTDEEVDKVIGKMLSRLKKELGVTLREA